MNVNAAVAAVVLLSAASAAAESGWRVYQQPDSKEIERPPRIASLRIVPMGASTAPELEGIAEFLSRRFPGLKIEQGERVPLPAGSYDVKRGQVIWQQILPLLPPDIGVLYVVEEDLAPRSGNYRYALYHLPTARGVASVARFRAPDGEPSPPRTRLRGPAYGLARDRLRNQLMSSAAKLFGMSFPCHAEGCVLRAPVRIADIDAKSTSFCRNHADELTVIAGQRQVVEGVAQPNARADQSGELSRTLLLRAWKLDNGTAAERDAPAGIGFEFLVIRRPQSTGAFTLAEVRDADIGGRSFRALTRALLGGEFEPQTEILDPADVRVASGDPVAQAFALDGGTAAVMRVLLFGARVKQDGTVVVRPEVGWGKKTEKFEFALPFDSLQLEPKSY